jgi:hypothetical protein
VSTAASELVPYQVVYSERAQQRLLALADLARERGDGKALLAAVNRISPTAVSLPPIWRTIALEMVLECSGERGT